jgi:NADH-quinone oxidoreductase subunit J
MAPLQIIFYAFAAIAVISATLVISARNPMRSVLALVVTFFAMAGIWMMLRAEFLSIILVLVYVGAVMTLFLFVVMMLNIRKETVKRGWVKYFPFALIVVLAIVGLTIAGIGPETFGLSRMPIPDEVGANYNNAKQLGQVLYTNYVLPFELAGVLLLAAIIAAITLAHRPPQKRKAQDPAQQVAVTASDRLRIIKGLK